MLQLQNMNKDIKSLETKIKELEKKLDLVLNMLMSEYMEDEGEELPFDIHAIEHDLTRLN